MSERRVRHALIRRLLQAREVSSQDELARLLAEEGVQCTQATLSRDLRDLGVVRVRGPRGARYELDQRSRYLRALREVVGMEITEVRHNGQLVVLRTLNGRAEGVAGFLDAMGDPRIMGTVAGDDTVFVAPADPARCAELADALNALIDGVED